MHANCGGLSHYVMSSGHVISVHLHRVVWGVCTLVCECVLAGVSTDVRKCMQVNKNITTHASLFKSQAAAF